MKNKFYTNDELEEIKESWKERYKKAIKENKNQREEFLEDLKRIKKYPKDKTRFSLILKKWEERSK